MKGIAPLIEGVILISIALVVSTMVGYFLLAASNQGAQNTESYSSQKIDCSFANFYVGNVTFDAGGDCSPGVNHTINITLKNNGQTSLEISDISIETISGAIINVNFSGNLSPGARVVASSVTDVSCVDLIEQNNITGYTSLISKVRALSKTCPLEGVLENNYITFLNADQGESMPGKYAFGLWRFNDNLNDSSSFGNAGLFSGGSPNYVPGRTEAFGNALQMDGENDYLVVPDVMNSSATNQMTIEVWFKSYNQGGWIISN